MTKFIDPSFSSRPASQKYRDNWEATFKTKRKRCKCVDGNGFIAGDMCGLTITSDGNLCDWCIANCKETK